MAKLEKLRMERDREDRLHLTFVIDGEAQTMTLPPGDYVYVQDDAGRIGMSFTLRPSEGALREVLAGTTQDTRARAQIEDDELIYADQGTDPLMTGRQFKAMLRLADSLP